MPVRKAATRGPPLSRRKASRSRDYTATSADRRVLRINLGIIRYGTDDKTQGAAVVFSLLLFCAICLVMILGSIEADREWFERVLQWLGSAFFFVMGVAIGKSGSTAS
ncbi:MAG: hypothetical protein ACJ8ER_07525 [Allosphingosinicella sp.]